MNLKKYNTQVGEIVGIDVSDKDGNWYATIRFPDGKEFEAIGTQYGCTDPSGPDCSGLQELHGQEG
jgi:hypothetical protein